MSSAATGTRRDLETRLIEKAWKDPQFKWEVVRNPKQMFETYLGTKLPADLTIIIHEEDEHTLHFSIPPTPSKLNELSDQELERVAGGTDVIVVMTMFTASAAVSGLAVGTAVGTIAASAASGVSKGW